MNDIIAASPARCAVVLLAATAAAGALLAWLLPGPLDPATTVDPALLTADRVLVGLADAALAGCACWAWLVTVLVTREALAGRRRPVRGVPAWARRWVLAACGAALVGATLPGVSVAAPASAPDIVDPTRPAVSSVGRTAPRIGVTVRRDPPAPRRYVVQPGDTLWDLAEGEIGEDATARAVSAYWQRIHRRNRAVVGTDPDLILPGQQLRVPLPPHDREEPR